MHSWLPLLLTLPAQSLAQMTQAAQLYPRQNDPNFVGYIAANGSYSDPRSCDYPATLSTSGNYVQCFPTTGAVPFYTACSSNTLLAPSGTSNPCDVDTALACNTGIVLASAGASSGPSYIACWQKTIGSSPFTFVQDIGTATPVAASSTGSAAPSGSSPTSAATSTSRSGSATSAAASSSRSSAASSASASAGSASASASAPTSANAAIGGSTGMTGGVFGVLALMAHALL